MLKCVASVAMLVAGIFPLWACGQTFTVAITSNGVTATGTVQIEGAVRTFTSQVGPNGTVTWDIDGCQGSVSGLQPNSPCTIVCKDPLLMQWPDAWTFVGGTWTDMVGGGSGPIIIAPAGGFLLEPVHGPITTDPGHSAYVARLSVDNLGPTTFELAITFDTHGVPGCVKGFDVAVVTPVSGPPYIVPQEGLPLNFTLLSPPDFHVVCLGSAGIPSLDRYGMAALLLLISLVMAWGMRRMLRRAS
jgi:hypothetical protein